MFVPIQVVATTHKRLRKKYAEKNIELRGKKFRRTLSAIKFFVGLLSFDNEAIQRLEEIIRDCKVTCWLFACCYGVKV